MIYLIVLALIVVLVGTIMAMKHAPLKVQIGLIIILSLILAWLHWSVARTQLATTGFAAGNRDPNYLTQYIGYALAALGILNTILALKSTPYAAILLGLLLVPLPILYLASW